MKKYAALLLSVLLGLPLAACAEKYTVTIAEDYPIANELEEAYAAGEEVTIQLDTVTEQGYALFVNGVKQNIDLEKSNMVFTYFVFTMPSEDVVVEIEEYSVDIPRE